MIKGITVTLYERTQIGTDDLNAPTYKEIPTQVKNVLVSPVAAEAVISELQLHGKRLVYELCVPKGDQHNWKDCRVDFFGQSFKVFGDIEEWIEANVPLAWNKKVRVERIE